VYFDKLKETIRYLIALCKALFDNRVVTSYRTNVCYRIKSYRIKEGGKCRCYSVRNVKDCNFSVFNGVDLADDYGKFKHGSNENEFNVKTLSEEYLKSLWKVLFDVPFPAKPIKVYILSMRDFILVKFIYGASNECIGFTKQDKNGYTIVLPENYNDLSLYHELNHVFESESLRYYIECAKKEG
jgi:hypothetical protein